MGELQEAVARGKQADIEDEFGDVLFSLANYARFLHIDAEGSLEKTNKKFIRRFQEMESVAISSGKALSSMTLEEMDAIWNQVKIQMRNS